MFKQVDAKQTGKISIMQAQDVLLCSKKINLTPFQIQILIGLSKPDKNGNISYKDFSFKCRDMIDDLFSMKALSEKASMIQKGTFEASSSLEEVQLTKLDMFKVSSVDSLFVAL